MWRLAIKSRQKPANTSALSQGIKYGMQSETLSTFSSRFTPVGACRRSLSLPVASSLNPPRLELPQKLALPAISPHDRQRATIEKLLETLKASAISISSGLPADDSCDPWVRNERLFHIDGASHAKVNTVSNDGIPSFVERSEMDTCPNQPEIENRTVFDTKASGKLEWKTRRRHGHPGGRKSSVEVRLDRAINAQRVDDTVQIFRESLATKTALEKNTLSRCFEVLLFNDAEAAYDVLCRYREIHREPMKGKRYAQLCDELGRDRTYKRRRDIVKKLTRELKGLDKETYQQLCFPRLVRSIIKQKDRHVGRTARPLYNYMKKCQFVIGERMLENYLSHSRYSRQYDLPFHTILSELTSKGYRPYPPYASQVLQNLFPFTDIEATSTALKAVLHLQSSTKPSDKYQVYRIDIGTLEQITAAGARKASPELNVLVWDLLEVFGYQPTEAMFENTIQAFCMSYRQDHNLFAVLAEMEDHGFDPSRALVRTISRSLRFSTSRADNAYYMLTHKENDWVKLSVSSLNVILSACGEQGEVDRAFATFDDFNEYKLRPNSDSYSFLLEALAKSMAEGVDEFESDTDYKKQSLVEAAKAVVKLMETDGLLLSGHALDAYVKVLHFAGDTEEALDAVKNVFESKQNVLNKTIYFIATQLGACGQIDNAKKIASMLTEPNQFRMLDKQIHRWESNSDSK